MTPTFAEVCKVAEDADHPVLRMLKDADERLGRMDPDVIGARCSVHGARPAVAIMITNAE